MPAARPSGKVERKGRQLPPPAPATSLSSRAAPLLHGSPRVDSSSAVDRVGSRRAEVVGRRGGPVGQRVLRNAARSGFPPNRVALLSCSGIPSSSSSSPLHASARCRLAPRPRSGSTPVSPSPCATASSSGPTSSAQRPTGDTRCWSIARPTAGTNPPTGPAGAGRRAPGIRRRASGCPRPLRVRRRVRALPSGGPGRLRHHRVGRAPAVVRTGAVGTFGLSLPRRGAVARRGRAPAVAQGDGAGDDLLDAGELLVLGRRVGRLLARLDLAQHRAGPPPPARRRRTRDRRRGRAAWDTGRSRGATIPADARAAATSRASRPGTTSGCAIRPATPGGASARLAGTLRPGARGGAQPLRLVRRDVRAERRGGELSRRAGDALVLWDPGPTASTPVQRRKAGERDFGADAALDYDGTVLGWMDRHVQGRDSASAEPPVRVFVMGSNRWRSADRWPFAGSSARHDVSRGRGGRRAEARAAGRSAAGRAAEERPSSARIPPIR